MSSIIKVNTVQDTDGNNIINENANTITIGKSGDTVQVASGASLVGAGIEWQSSIVTAATITVVAGRGYWLDTSSNAITVTLPASASVGDQIILTDYARNWGTNAVTINQNGLNFQGYTSPNPKYNTTGQSVDIVYSGATKGWIPNSDDDVEAKNLTSAEYLVVAGGGAGASRHGGGGGAGGFLTNFGGTAITLSSGVTYTVTVGAGGASVSGGSDGNTGNDSVLSGTGITTITADGGGGGGRIGAVGLDGGSGGGAGGFQDSAPRNGGAGTAGQGNDGGDVVTTASTAPGYGGAGGGGAGAVGEGVPSGNGDGGDGGVGLANSITGSSTFYAGGGGGSSDNGNGAPGQGLGGNGGGGAASESSDATSGTANTGGGGGGVYQFPSQNTGAGGSGVVILRMPTGKYTGTTSGSPTVTTSGTDTIIKFTASGSYTA